MAGVAESAYRPVPPVVAANPARGSVKYRCGKGNPEVNASSPSGQGIADLPFSYGKSFDTLDSYLAHLECHAAPIDQPWWREIRPGVFQEMTTATDAKPRTATRSDLMKRYGFHR